MQKNSRIFIFAALPWLVAGFLGALIFWQSAQNAETRVTFLDVGQGDAILLSHGSEQVLIDSGREGKRLLAALGRHMPFWDRSLTAVIATHPDADHIGGFAALLRNYQVSAFVSTGASTDTAVSRELKDALSKAAGVKSVEAGKGTVLRFPAGGELTFLFPSSTQETATSETNEASIVAKFIFGETEFLLTGDLPNEERFIADLPQADILKVAHHGSRFSTSDVFLDTVKPVEAVVSVGENSYGHPHPDVLGRLERRGIRVHRTDETGDVTYRCHTPENRCIVRR